VKEYALYRDGNGRWIIENAHGHEYQFCQWHGRGFHFPCHRCYVRRYWSHTAAITRVFLIRRQDERDERAKERHRHGPV
jgi:hypothetical protein